MTTSLMNFYRDAGKLSEEKIQNLNSFVRELFPEFSVNISIVENETLRVNIENGFYGMIVGFDTTEVFNGCAYLLCHNNYFSKIEYFESMDKIKNFIANSANYSCLMATEISHRHFYNGESVLNKYLKNGWKILDTRHNRRTNHEINLLIKDLE